MGAVVPLTPPLQSGRHCDMLFCVVLKIAVVVLGCTELSVACLFVKLDVRRHLRQMTQLIDDDLCPVVFVCVINSL